MLKSNEVTISLISLVSSKGFAINNVIIIKTCMNMLHTVHKCMELENDINTER